MADTNNVMTYESQEDVYNNKCSDAVCIDAMRVYDSCGDKDCLTDLRVYFTDEVQTQIDNAVSVRIKDADVVTVVTNLEPVPFNKGFYSVDMTFFFNITLDLFTSPGSVPVTVSGISIFNKKVILFGSDGNVKVFTSEYTNDTADIDAPLSRRLPRVTVQVAKPIALSAKLNSCCCGGCVPCSVPRCVCNCIGAEPTASGNKCVFVTLGMFSIVQIERNVQMLVHAYDYCIPEKECTNSTDNPCEVFSRLDFPKEQFFPPNICDKNCGCSCNH